MTGFFRLSRKTLAIVLIGTLVQSNVSVPVNAADAESISVTITAFEPLPVEVAEQNIYVGEGEDSIYFPSSLNVTVENTWNIVTEKDDETEHESVIDSETEQDDETEHESVIDSETEQESEQLFEFEQSEPLQGNDENVPEESESGELTQEQIDSDENTLEQPESVENGTELPSADELLDEENVIEDQTRNILDMVMPAVVVYAAESVETEESEGYSDISNETVTSSENIVIEDITWVLDALNSSSNVFSSENAGDRFVYFPAISDNFEVVTDLPCITVNIIEKEIVAETESFSHSEDIAGYNVAIYAPDGVFPKGTTVSIEVVSDPITLIENELSDDRNIQQIITFDISFWFEGKEIEPEKGEVNVAISLASDMKDALMEDDSEIQVFHIDDDSNIEEVSCSASNEEVSFNADSFSKYTLVASNRSVGLDSNAAPQNLLWKNGALATATWSALNGANYYLVNVLVKYNGQQIGTAQTGTSEVEIDLQQEINRIVGNNNYPTVEGYFSVTPQMINSDGTIITGKESALSAALSYSTTALNKLDTPTNVTLTANESHLTVSWNRVANAECYSGEYRIINPENNSEMYGLIITSPMDSYPEVISQEFSEYMTYQANRLGLLGKTIRISARIAACPFGNTATNYTSSDYSEWSNEVDFYVNEFETHKLSTPVITSYDRETLVLNATCENVADYVNYYVDIRIGNDNYSTDFSTNRESEYARIGNGIVYINYLTTLNSFLVRNNISNVNCRLRLGLNTSVFSGNGYSQYEESDTVWTDYFYYTVGAFPKFEKPTNIKWTTSPNYSDTDHYAVTFNRDPKSDVADQIELKIRNNSTEKIVTPGYGYGPSDEGVVIPYIDVHSAYLSSGMEPSPVYISVRFRIGSSQNSPYQLISSDVSDWSEELFYNPGNKKIVESLNLSPTNPVCAVGRSLYLGKTISPEDAYYDSISWSCDNETIATVDETGKLSAKAVGSATISAKIFDATGSVTVSTYEITTNVESGADKEAITDTTGGIIDDIVNNDNPDISKTDLNVGEVADAKDDIREGVERGDSFRSDIWQNQHDSAYFKDNWGKVKEIVADGEFAAGFDVGVEVYHKDRSNNKHHIANITQFDREIGFRVDPDKFPEGIQGQLNNLSLVRIHEGKADAIPFTVNNDGSILVHSDRFSDFVFVTSGSDSASGGDVNDFVKRLYRTALNREPDEQGFNDWVNQLSSGQKKAVDIVQGFLCSPEYQSKGKTNADVVTDCYIAMLGRNPDPAGYNDWVSRFDSGMSINAIFAGFVGSDEFANLCSRYGISPGVYPITEERDKNTGVTKFVSRLYTQALGRNFDVDGLNDWCGQINANTSRDNILRVATDGFFHSQEFANKNLNNEDFVKVCYRTYLGREYDDPGLADWLGKLDRGEMTRDQVMEGFAYSIEFGNIMSQYGL